ncbi:tetratricopeptide repeat-containing hybrid sensor histidine kinase/response regulator [Phaeocystidibacter marisrubri]|uniref:histidine kinase n=1 Tax=Phaeocystidibacter marisrubri TaxID=1577780 RepID=A0A6L3ZE52_9FLAO|nr:ATP-binding protein [Phaeocystidibacter marisrubri]KAB2815714.1 response regulator [Phaeocystidibacter marisrubri]GGH65332.1 hypothetical protein GCM10011318_02230 [Phaeocystidibacter marisrubri]
MPQRLLIRFLFAALTLSVSVQGQTAAHSGQERIIDSLQARIRTGLADTSDVKYYIRNIYSLASFDPLSSIQLNRAYSEIALREKDTIASADLKSHLGNIFRGAGLYEQAIENYMVASEYYEQVENYASLSYALINVGNIFYDLKQFGNAAHYYQNVLDIEDNELAMQKAKTVALNNLGLIAQEHGNYELARTYFLKSFSIRKSYHSPDNISHSHLHLAELFTKMELYDSVSSHLSRSLNQVKKIPREYPVYGERLWQILQAHVDQEYARGNYELAHIYADSALAQALLNESTYHEVRSLLQQARVCYEVNNLSEAADEVQAAYNLAVSSNLNSFKIEALEFWIKLAKKSNSLKEVIRLQSGLIDLQKQLQSERKGLDVATRIYQAEISRIKEESRQEQNKRQLSEEKLETKSKVNQLLVILLVTVVIFSIVVLVMIIQITRKRKKSAEDHKTILAQKSEIEQTNERLQRTNKLLEESLRENSTFMSKMSHEIRTPMNAIGGLTELLLGDNLSPDQEQLVRNINHSSQRLTALVDDILDYSRLEGGRVRLQPRNFKLGDLISDIIALNKSKAESNGTLIHSRIDTSIPTYLYGDADRLGQILNNLLSNAVKFTEAGHVHLRVFEDEEMLSRVRIGFEVEDTGIGIEEGNLASIFDEFKQANSEIHSRYGGTGLGLAISQQLVELMGGTISVRSTIGKGSIFYFSIPFEIGKEDEHATASTPANLSDKTILLVEDDKMNQFVAQKMLDTTGVAIQIATNGLEATEMALAQKFDLILMDIQMPVMNGFEATQRIRNEGKNTSTPIIALTADVQGETKTKALEAGMNDLLTKPFHKLTLIETITSYLS